MAKGLLHALGEELRASRLRRGMSQEELAGRAGLHRNYVGLLERGQRNPTLLVLAEHVDRIGVVGDILAAKLKVSVAELIAAAERNSR